jgi:hypothetical protein
MMVVPKRNAANVLFPEPAGPHSTRSVLGGTLTRIGMPVSPAVALSIIAMLSFLWYNGRAYVCVQHIHRVSRKYRGTYERILLYS